MLPRVHLPPARYTSKQNSFSSSCVIEYCDKMRRFWRFESCCRDRPISLLRLTILRQVLLSLKGLFRKLVVSEKTAPSRRTTSFTRKIHLNWHLIDFLGILTLKRASVLCWAFSLRISSTSKIL